MDDIELARLVLLWEEFADEVTEGWSDDWYEYTNALDIRRLIEDRRDALPASLAARLVRADERVMAATDEVDSKVWGWGSTHDWFFRRIPKTGGPEFQREVSGDTGLRGPECGPCRPP